MYCLYVPSLIIARMRRDPGGSQTIWESMCQAANPARLSQEKRLILIPVSLLEGSLSITRGNDIFKLFIKE